MRGEAKRGEVRLASLRSPRFAHHTRGEAKFASPRLAYVCMVRQVRAAMTTIQSY